VQAGASAVRTKRESGLTRANARANTPDRLVDLTLFAVANAMNLMMVGVFLGRVAGRSDAHWPGEIWALLAAILAGGAFINWRRRRPGWEIGLPLPLVAFLLVELILDYALGFDFRHTLWVGPYLLLYYLGLMAMIGYAFRSGKGYGLITLATYFLNQGATFYAYFLAGHG
jgi:hypothetical protein